MIVYGGLMEPLHHPVFRLFFTAQVLSLLGIGVLTVALALTTYRVAGAAAAGALLGAILALKMVSYVLVAPIAEAALSGFDPRRTLIALNVVRIGVLVPMAAMQSPWHLASTAFVFFTASAAFTPLHQATVPAILRDDGAYSRALSLSRLASSTEALISPALAGAALAVIDGPALFPLAMVLFAGSTVALLFIRLDRRSEHPRGAPFVRRALRGIRIELRTPRLRELLAMNLGSVARSVLGPREHHGLRGRSGSTTPRTPTPEADVRLWPWGGALRLGRPAPGRASAASGA